MKTLAMYLPQYHRIPENDAWWGEGFTDWTAVRSAKPLFEGHFQPRVPLNNNYYDLMDAEVLRWQSGLALKYGIDGFCIYHYWFENGKQILEKPAELLLNHKDIEISFCFCWANQTWARTWSKVRGANGWADIFENKKGDVLLSQKYGREQQWTEHFAYLKPFFEDSRYVYIDKKPVVVIYNCDGFSCLPEMIRFWNKLAEENGFNGIYFIGENCNRNIEIDGLMKHQPGGTFSISERTCINQLSSYEFLEVQNNIDVELNGWRKQFYMGLTGFDDTPRRGMKGTVVQNIDTNQFKEACTYLLEKSVRENVELFFINAWNEWGEGMYLEPDEHFGYAFLEAYESAKESVSKKHINVMQPEYGKKMYLNRRENYYLMVCDWMRIKNKGNSLAYFCNKYGWNNVAIYGIGDIGLLLYDELISNGIVVKYFVDKEDKKVGIIPVYSISDSLPAVDAMIITPYLEYTEIRRMLDEKLDCHFVSVEEMVQELQ